MKHKKVLGLLLSAALLSGAAAAAAEAGSSGDPLIALSWVRDTFMPQVLHAAQDRINTGTEAAYQEALHHMTAPAPVSNNQEYRVKLGDTITIRTGSELMTFAGTVAASVDGAVVDLTDGVQSPTQFQLQPKHRYLAAEDTEADFVVCSDTAVIRMNGFCELTPSTAVDYNVLADALHEMGLFRGTNSGYGSGSDLEKAPSRIQGLIMFLRLMGEEQDAL